MWSLFRRKAQPTKPIRRQPTAQRPCLEVLEDRCLLSAGALDPTFNPSGNPPGTATVATSTSAGAKDVLVQPSSGNIVLIGNGTDSSGNLQASLAQFQPNGSLDTNFGSGGTVVGVSQGKSTLTQPGNAVLYPTGSSGDEQILVVGEGPSGRFGTQVVLARFNANGSLDSSFGNKGIVAGPSVQQAFGYGGSSGGVLVPNGTSLPKIIVVTPTEIQKGGGNHSTSITGLEVARYNPDGSLDNTFGPNGNGTVFVPLPNNMVLGGLDGGGLALDPVNHDIIVAGSAGTSATSQTLGMLAAINPTTGALDPNFGTDGIVSSPLVNGTPLFFNASDVAIDSSGNVDVVVENSKGEWGVARYTSSGTLDTSWGKTGVVFTVIGKYTNYQAVTVQPDGTVLASGYAYYTTNEQNYSALVLYTSDGTLDTTFGTNGAVTTLLGRTTVGLGVTLQPNGDIVQACGTITAAGLDVFAVARYLPSQPEIGSFTANPNPVGSNRSVTLTASSITDGNPNSTITRITFYYFDNNGNKVVLGTGSEDSSGDWTLISADAFGLTAGTYTVYAQAADNYGVLGIPDSLTLTVQ